MKKSNKKFKQIVFCFSLFLILSVFSQKSISQNFDSLTFHDALFQYKQIYGVLKVKFEQNDTTYFMISRNDLLFEMLQNQFNHQQELKRLGYKKFMLKYAFAKNPLLLTNVSNTFRKKAKKIFFLKENHTFSINDNIKHCVSWIEQKDRYISHHLNTLKNIDLWHVGSVRFGMNCLYKMEDLILWFYKKNIMLDYTISPSYLSRLYQAEKKK